MVLIIVTSFEINNVKLCNIRVKLFENCTTFNRHYSDILDLTMIIGKLSSYLIFFFYIYKSFKKSFHIFQYNIQT